MRLINIIYILIIYFFMTIISYNVEAFSSSVVSIPTTATGVIGITIEDRTVIPFVDYPFIGDNNDVNIGETFEVWIDDTYKIDIITVPLDGSVMEARYSPQRNGYISGIHKVKIKRIIAQIQTFPFLTIEGAYVEDEHFINLPSYSVQILPEKYLTNPSNVSVIVSGGTNIDNGHKLEVKFATGEKIGDIIISDVNALPLTTTFANVNIPVGDSHIILVENKMTGHVSQGKITKSTFNASILSVPSNGVVDIDYLPRIKFSDYMDKTSFNEINAIQIKRLDNSGNFIENVSFSVNYTESEKLLRINPLKKLFPGYDYQVRISTAVRYETGANIPSDMVFSFSTIKSATLQVSDFLSYPSLIKSNHLSTLFSYELSENADNSEIRIYSKSGKLMQRFYDLPVLHGYNDAVHWDLRDHFGKLVPNGVYFVELYIKKGADAQKIRHKLIIQK